MKNIQKSNKRRGNAQSSDTINLITNEEKIKKKQSKAIFDHIMRLSEEDIDNAMRLAGLEITGDSIPIIKIKG